MSFTRLDYDTCTYKHTLKQSVGTGDYMLNTPTIECQRCFSFDPAVNMQKGAGGAECGDKPLVDVDSELIGITRKASNCPTEKFIPSREAFCTYKTMPDCRGLPKEDTRMSNPPCTLRGNGWNRWEWLCKNPQENAMVPFDFNINNRLIVKDNHRPCVPKPLSTLPVLPPDHFSGDVYTGGQACGANSAEIPSVHWRKACEYKAYGV
jgi:hypothetical protein